MDEETREERPNLCQLLEERLPDFGLEVETYGPYVVNSDSDEVPDVVELLKASSEKEDEQDIWESFTADILKSLKLDEDYQQEKVEEKKRQAQKLEQERAEKNKAAIESSSSSQPQKAQKSSQMDDEQKKALMQRFAYENPDEDADAPTVVTNKQTAATAHMEKAQELRSKKTTTKKEEQQKTKENRASKAQLKEERRKKAIKGERKR